MSKKFSSLHPRTQQAIADHLSKHGFEPHFARSGKGSATSFVSASMYGRVGADNFPSLKHAKSYTKKLKDPFTSHPILGKHKNF